MSITHPLRCAGLALLAGACCLHAAPVAAASASRTAAMATAPFVGGAAGPNRVPVVASYAIEARLDPDTHRIDGREVIRWRNASRRPASELWLHLYLNGFRSTASSWLRHSDRRSIDELSPDGWGWIELASLEADGANLLGDLRYEAPDDGNPDDRTVARVPLPREVAPGETIEITVAFLAQLPRVVARTGYHRDFHLVGQWFPKLGVLERDGSWNCHQFHPSSEFFSDFGNYDVSITVPRDFVVGATGRRVETRDAPDEGWVTHRYVQDGVHDFAWTAWPDFVERTVTFRSEGLPQVAIRLLLRPETARFANRYAAALGAALEHFGHAYGPYPYPTLTMVDPPWGAREAGGMEYPTFIATGTHVLSPLLSQDPESVTVHEFGHEFFYGLLATDEMQESYLDEGINTYATARVLADVYGPETWTYRAWDLPIPFRGVTLDQPLDTSARYFLRPSVDPVARTSWGYLDRRSYGAMTYSKMSLLLAQLERMLGTEVFDRAMHDYALEWRYRHPRTADFIRSLSRSVGQDLGGYFRQTLYGSQVLDFAVDSATSERRRGPIGVFGEGEDRETTDHREKLPGWESEVVVRRLGGVRLPVVTELVFADGKRAMLRWDGQDRWVRFRVTGPELLWARVDPEGTLLLDVDRINNSRRVEPDRRASRRWGQRVRFWIQNVLETFAAFA